MTSGDKNDLKITYIFESERELDDFKKVYALMMSL